MTFWLSDPSQAALPEFPVEVPWKLVLLSNAQDQKRAEILSLPAAPAPVFCILMLGCGEPAAKCHP